MKFENVGLVSVGYTLPSEIISSSEIERRLEPVYQRLKLPEGRLAMMSGIEERRLWAAGSRLSDRSVESCLRAIEGAGIDRKEIGALIHGSVCREFLEPATACRVHALCQLPSSCWVYDVSNACLGVLNGAIQIATLIEQGLLTAGIVVGTEDASGLLNATIQQLLNDTTLTRQTIKPAFASLTIGSGSCAWLLVDRRKYPNSAPIHAAVAIANTAHHDLCQSDTDQAGGAMQPIMNTDSEQLLLAGVATGVSNFQQLKQECGWNEASFEQTVCHQVGTAHRKLMLESLGLPTETDFATFSRLGNTGSVALPTALGVGLRMNQLQSGKRTGLLGIGSGINSIMIAMTLENVVGVGEDLTISTT